jgi:hypothetical protein
MGKGGQRHAPVALSPGKNRYPSYRRLGGPQGQSGRMRNISSPLEFDPWTVQPIAISYTDWAIPARVALYGDFFLMKLSKLKVSSTALN